MEKYRVLFKKYLQNELDGYDLKELLNWLNQPENSKQIEEWMGEDWNSFNFKQANDDLTSFERSIPTTFKKDKTQETSSTIKRIIYRIAATVALPIAIGALTYFVLSKTDKAETIAYNEINVPMGSKSKIALSDGTVIWLNSGSKLRYPQKFTGKTREVELTGEGYFDVKKNPDNPFVVNTTEIKIKVLGTSFNVKSYPDERSVETTLVKGLVTITKQKTNAKQKSEELYLKPNQRATFIKDKGKLILSEIEKQEIKKEHKTGTAKKAQNVILSRNIDTEQFTAWKDNKLIFKNEDFESLCIKLERWFNVKINLHNEELKKYHYTGTIENETINDVINLLHITMQFKYDINHSVVDIWNSSR